ncbi:hypothetical protein ABW21_db0206232 [Orbilia brochopaga]|nr:hypothetical protein ABW21_db0206232 [Drechslerella brochopaga]
MSSATFGPNAVSLNIANTNGAEYYDQICAISQETINKNFEVLFNQRKDLVELWYKDISGDDAILEAVLDPPQIKLEIGSSDLPELYFEIHFKTGQIKLAADKIQNIDNWVITVRSELFNSQVTPNPNHTDEEAALAAASLEEIKMSYNIEKITDAIKSANPAGPTPPAKKEPTPLEPGDYSIQRLYCVVAEGNWSVPDEERSYVPDPDFPNDKSKRISLAQWRQAESDPHIRLMAHSVSMILGNWAQENQESAFWNLGIQVQLPKDKVAAERALATCAPQAVRLQNYAYITEANQQKLEREKREGQTPTPISSLVEYGNPQNCLVFCETVLRDLPKAGARLEYGGNLAEPPRQSIPPIPGTFVLDHRLYFEKKILQPLREACVATSVIPCWPNMYTDHQGVQRFQSRYVVGGNPDDPSFYPGLPDQKASNPVFDFKLEAPGRYAWRKTWPAPGSGTEVKTYTDCNDAPVYRKWLIEAKNAVEVSWNPGSSEIVVRGSVRYDHWEAYNSKDMNFDWRGYSDCLWGEFYMNVSWSFNILLSDNKMTFEQKKQALKDAAQKRKEEEKGKADGTIPRDAPSTVPNIPNGIINPVVSGLNKDNHEPDDLYVTGGGGQYVLDQTDTKMRTQVANSLHSGLEKALSDISTALRDAGHFTYPGTRTLVFDEPKLGDAGNIITTIDYIELDDGLVVVNPPIPKPVDESGSKTVAPVDHDSTVTGNPAHVTWNPKITYVAHTQRVTLILEGRNNAPDPMAFEEIEIELLPTNGKCLFVESAYDWMSQDEADDLERQKNQENGNGTNGSSSTPATLNAAADSKNPPNSTWKFSQREIEEDLQVTPDQDSTSLIFRVKPVPPPQKTRKLPRFTIQRGGYFSLTLDGPVNGPGEYILQLDETWNYPDYTKDMKGKRSATTFLKAVLVDGNNGSIYVTSQADADNTRGIPST